MANLDLAKNNPPCITKVLLGGGVGGFYGLFCIVPRPFFA